MRASTAAGSRRGAGHHPRAGGTTGPPCAAGSGRRSPTRGPRRHGPRPTRTGGPRPRNRRVLPAPTGPGQHVQGSSTLPRDEQGDAQTTRAAGTDGHQTPRAPAPHARGRTFDHIGDHPHTHTPRQTNHRLRPRPHHLARRRPHATSHNPPFPIGPHENPIHDPHHRPHQETRHTTNTTDNKTSVKRKLYMQSMR